MPAYKYTKDNLIANIIKTSEKHEVYFDVFHSEEIIYSKFTSNIIKTSESSYKRVNKSILLFPTSAKEFRRSHKHEVYFDVSHSECSLYSWFTTNVIIYFVNKGICENFFNGCRMPILLTCCKLPF